MLIVITIQFELDHVRVVAIDGDNEAGGQRIQDKVCTEL